MSGPENVYAKVARAVLRLIAFALIVIGLLLYIDDLRLYLGHLPLSSRRSLALKAIPLALGLVILCASGSLAERLTRDLD